MKVLLDTNVLLDIVLDRTPHNTHSIALFELIDSKEIEGCISATTVTDLYYVAAKERGQKVAKDFIVNLVDLVEVLGVDETIIRQAILSDFKDFEDAIQHETALLNSVEVIATRNISDFQSVTTVPVFHPKDLLIRLKSGNI